MSNQHTDQHPPQPPFPKQPQPTPGTTEAMLPQPDHGEQSYQGHQRLKDKVAIITGGDSGIGRAVALAFAREGADVLISYLNEDDDAQATCELVKQAGRRSVAIPGDIGELAQCQQIVGQAIREFGKIDILVNNAAYQMTHESIQELSAQELEHTFRTNIFAMFYLCQAALPHMPEGGSIINTASVQAYHPSAQLLAYATTKGAIVAFTKGLAQEAIQQGVRVNCVAPGPVWTPLIPSTMPEEKVSTFGKDTPIGRVAQPAELAPLYAFLASDESSYIVGEVVGVTGGKPLG